MRVLVINYSGNVGKSTIAQHVLMERLNKPTLIRVETVNSDGLVDGEKHSANHFDDIFNSIFTAENDVVVDVGSSNIEAFYKKLTQEWAGSHEFFDYFIIPTPPSVKQQQDTATIVNDFLLMGAKPEQIKLVLTMVDSTIRLENDYKVLIDAGIERKLKIEFDKLPVIHFTQLFSSLEKHELTYDEIKNDNKNHKELLASAKTPEDRKRLSFAMLFKNGLTSYQKDLDVAFKALNLKR